MAALSAQALERALVASILVYKQYGHRPPAPERSTSEALIPHVKTAEARPFAGTIEIAVEGVLGVEYHRGGAGRVEGGGDLVADIA